MKKKLLIVISIVIVCVIGLLLVTNKTFFKTTYIGVHNEEIFIPRFSYFKREAGMTVASFYSLKSEKTLKKEIANYMEEFQYYDEKLPYVYKKGNLVIYNYSVGNEGLYRKIYIEYGTE